MTISLFIWRTRLVKGSFRIEALTLFQIITENRLRHARGDVQFHIESITLLVANLSSFTAWLIIFTFVAGLLQFSSYACHCGYRWGELLDHRAHHHQRHVRQGSTLKNVGHLLLCYSGWKVRLFRTKHHNCFFKLLTC